MHTIGRILVVLGEIYFVILIVRAILSWFPESGDSPLRPVRRITFVLTEPVLAPFRRLIPPFGGLDLSFLVAVLALQIIIREVFARL
jgi:YggT family protein